MNYNLVSLYFGVILHYLLKLLLISLLQVFSDGITMPLFENMKVIKTSFNSVHFEVFLTDQTFKNGRVPGEGSGVPGADWCASSALGHRPGSRDTSKALQLPPHLVDILSSNTKDEEFNGFRELYELINLFVTLINPAEVVLVTDQSFQIKSSIFCDKHFKNKCALSGVSFVLNVLYVCVQ